MSAEAEKSEASEPAASKKGKRNFWLILFSGIFLLAGLAWFIFWLFIGRFDVATEDAYVHGNSVMLTAQVTAGVKTIYADDTDLVKEGQLVVELDPTDYEIQIEERKKKLADTVREVAALFQESKAKIAEIELRRAQWELAKQDLKNREPLVQTGAVSREEFQTYETTSLVAQYNLEFAEKEYERIESLIVNTTVKTHPRVEQAAWSLRESLLDLIRCKIWAPATGFIAKRTAQVGEQVKIGNTLLYIVPLDQIWAEANYKETRLSRVRIGQPVRFTADMYGRRTEFHGHIEGFQPGSGEAFALLPPQNASGNWIKIVQRVPVRIKLRCEEILNYPLFLGLSLRVHTDVRDTSGSKLAQTFTKKPLYSTFIYEKQVKALEEFEPQIAEIIERNSAL